MGRMKTMRQVEEEGVDGCECGMQWALLLVNIPVALIGMALMALGAWTMTNRDYIGDLQVENGSLYSGFCIVVVVAGVLLVLIAALGGVAAFVENRTIIMAYYISVATAFVLLCVGVVLAFVYRMEVETALRSELRLSVADYNPEEPGHQITQAWDKMQRELSCCGVASSTAGSTSRPWLVWKTNKMLNSGVVDSRVPGSCCISKGDTGQTTDCSPDNQVNEELIYSADCFDRASDVFRDHVLVIAICGIVFAVALIVAAMLAICLYHLAD